MTADWCLGTAEIWGPSASRPTSSSLPLADAVSATETVDIADVDPGNR